MTIPQPTNINSTTEQPVAAQKDSDLEFLAELDSRVHENSSLWYRVAGEYRTSHYDKYHEDKSLTEEELNQVLSIAGKRKDIVIKPIKTCFGFKTGFSVVQIESYFPGVPITKEFKLKFLESQLPKNYDFGKMAEYFMTPENLEKAKFAGITGITGNPANYKR